jgi:two-component system LytT family response regulator
MINAIIIDDEKRARELLYTLIIENCPNVNIIDQCTDLPNGVKSIRKNKPDLIFLDIEMPGHTGLELLDFFDEKEIQFGIIFTTAYNEFAVKAFKLSAIDYLLKPMMAEDLVSAVERFERRFQPQKLETLVKNPEIQNNKIAIPIGQSIRFLDLNEIILLKADNSYTEIFMEDDSKLVVSRTLKNFEEVLQENTNFFRCHKSYMVNRNFIIDYVKSDGGYLAMKNKQQVPISPDKVSGFLNLSTIIKR